MQLRVCSEPLSKHPSLSKSLQALDVVQDLTARALDSLASFGERLSTRLFAAFLRAEGLAAQQHDSWDLGFTSTDVFTNADVLYEPTLAEGCGSFGASEEPPASHSCRDRLLGPGDQHR